MTVDRSNCAPMAGHLAAHAAPRALAPFALAASLLLAIPAVAQTTVAGVTAGALSVDETGSAGYTIPIAVPPGIAGMQPSVALVYQSHSGNGTAGVGWSLSASSSIHRCPQTLAQDGAIHGVDFSADDRFCLDGQRLVAIVGTYGADGTEYRTEIESFARITSHSTAGSGPLSFTVETKSGQTLAYGGTPDARLGVPGQDEIRLWSLSQVSDTLGNAMTYHYVWDAPIYPSTGDGPAGTPVKDYRLDRIEYTRNDAQSVTTQSKVQFQYEGRSDSRTSWQAGAALTSAMRIAAIETWTDSGSGFSLVKTYDLAYETSPATSRSRLTSIIECDAANSCLMPVSLRWQDSTNGFALSDPYELPQTIYTGSNRQRGEFIDVNGDGQNDWVVAYADGNWTEYRATYMSTPPVTAPPTVWPLSPPHQLPKPIFNTSTGRKLGEFVDVNGDGLLDWVEAYSKLGGGSYVSVRNTYLSTGGGWSLAPDYQLPNSIINIENGYRQGLFADVNGDGLPDWVLAYPGHKFTYLNTGTGWSLEATYQHPRTIYNNNGQQLGEFVDVNGDGLTDWIEGYTTLDGTYVTYRNTYLNTGSGWSYSAPHQLPTTDFNHTNGVKMGLFADVNGDGLQDWVYANPWVNKTYLSTGAGWLESLEHQLPTSLIDSNGTQQGEFHDVNGDGLADWIEAYTKLVNGTYVFTRNTYLSNGSGWDLSAANQLPNAIVNLENQGRQGLFADVNGDGLEDWVLAYPGYVHTYLSGHPAPDLLTSITDSLGRVSTIEYAPLTDSEVYSKDSDAVFPVVDIQAPLYVVKSVSSDDGVGGQKVTSYAYAGAKVHVQGRGFRGFRQMTATDEQTGIVTSTDYSQVFPTTAQVLSSVKTLSDGTTLKTLANTWDELSLNDGATVWPYVASSTSEDYEPNDGPGNSPVVTRTATATFDAFGNPTELVTETAGSGETFTETTENTYSNDTTNWHLGLVTRSEVTRTRPGAP